MSIKKEIPPTIQLKPGRERNILAKHPWIFSGAIQSIPDGVQPGGPVEVISSTGQRLGWGCISPKSQILVRMWSFDPLQPLTNELVRTKVQESISRRQYLQKSGITNAFRLVHSESDGLPGVILDLFDRVAVVQLLTTGACYWREAILSGILEFIQPECLIEKSEGEVLKLEGLSPRIEVIYGNYPPEGITIHENGINYHLDILGSQKTGFYLDQRENRKLIQKLCTVGKKFWIVFALAVGFP